MRPYPGASSICYTFMMQADNRGPSDSDMVMMSKINERIRTVHGSRVSFRLIANQVVGDEVHNMYQEEVVSSNFKSAFESLNITKFSFIDITMDNVLLLRYDEEAIKEKTLADALAADVSQHLQSAIKWRKS
ncbi:hypothetical protein BGZ82_011191 [Podila clonocystis]|nr:hypothetical protein BGZ82_011191 [Podila clonocystis]